MEFASQEALYSPTHHDHLQRAHIVTYPSQLLSTPFLEHLNSFHLYVLATLLCVVTFKFLRPLLSLGRQHGSRLKDFSQVVEELERKGTLCGTRVIHPLRYQDLGEQYPSAKPVSPAGVFDKPEHTKGKPEPPTVHHWTRPSSGTVFQTKEFVRPLGVMETLLATGGYYESINTIQALRLASSQPILPQDVREAVTTVAQRTEVLQLCVRWRWFWPWFCRVAHVCCPFKVVHEDVMEVYHKLMWSNYTMSRGPLWRVRLVPLPQPCPGRHEAVLLFTIHHCLTDAYTNMIICRETLQVLNATMRGRVYQPAPRACVPFTGDALVTSAHWLHALKFALFKIVSATLSDINSRIYFHGTIPQPETTSCVTKVLHEEFTVEATQRLRKRCKEAAVTVHSCIMTAAMLANFHMAQQLSDVNIKEAKMRMMNCVNMRRYFPSEYHEATGCHISVEEQDVTLHDIDGRSKESFWLQVKRYHADLQRNLYVDKTPVKNQPGLLPCALLLPINYWLTRLGRRNLTDSHMISTNMGDLRELLPGQYGDGPVEITHLLRCVSDPFTGHPYTIIFHTFRDRFSINLEYYANKWRDDTAALYFSLLTNYISDIMTYGTIGVSSDSSANVRKDKFC